MSFVAPPLEKPVAPPVDPAAPRETDPAAPSAEGDAGQDKPKKSGLPPTVFFVGAGATVILGGVTIWSGIDTMNNPGTERVSKECPAGQPITNCPTYQLGLDHERRTNILIAATSVVGVTTAVIGLFFTNWGGDETPKSDKKDAFIMPVVGVSNGVNIGAVGRF